jgi:predicted dehydrogenase
MGGEVSVIRYGLVGIGGFGAQWLQALSLLEERGVARVAAAAERDRAGNASAWAALEARGVPVYASFDEMLSRGEGRLDVIGVATGIAYHEPLASQALAAGYNVLVEKPVAGTIEEVWRLRALEQSGGHWCAVGYQWLHSPTLQWIRHKLEAGALGILREGRSVVGWPRAASYYARNGWAGHLRDGGRWILDGPATNATAHYLTNLLYLAGVRLEGGTPVATVRAELYRAKPIESYDTCCLEVTLANGVRLLHYASHALAERIEPIMTLIGSEGTLEWRAEDDSAVLRDALGHEERYCNRDMAFNHARSFAQVARVCAGLEPAPLSGLAEGGPQVLVINLAFRSAGEIATVPAGSLEQAMDAQGSALVSIRGMAAALQEATRRGVLFSELGLPWARESQTFAAAGFRGFDAAP